MANQGAKKRKEGNARHMSNLLRVIIGCNVTYILVRMIIFYSSFTWKHWIGLIFTSAAYAISYKQLASMAKPTYSDDGELIDGGFDMSTGGICGYLHDIIYITSFVQIALLISDKFWYTYLVVLRQLNVFSENDIDSAAEALNDMPIKKLYMLIEMAAPGEHGGKAEAIYSGKEKIDISHFYDCLQDVVRY